MRILSYNIHKGIGGRDRLYRFQRVLDVIEAENPDILCLQEVARNSPRSHYDDQPLLLAKYFKPEAEVFQQNVHLKHGGYGNLILSRWPIVSKHQISLRWNTKKPRPAGCCPHARRPAAPGEFSFGFGRCRTPLANGSFTESPFVQRISQAFHIVDRRLQRLAKSPPPWSIRRTGLPTNHRADFPLPLFSCLFGARLSRQGICSRRCFYPPRPGRQKLSHAPRQRPFASRDRLPSRRSNL